MKKLICVVLALLLVCSCACAETFSIRNGITWASTVNDITQAVGKEPEKDDLLACSRYFYGDVDTAGTTAVFMTYAVDEQPIVFVYGFFDADCAALADALSEKYASADASHEILLNRINSLYALIGEADATEEDLQACSYLGRWTASENTDIVLIGEDGNAMVFYFNVNTLENQSTAPVYTTDGL